jgi:uncharacterized protein (TIGR03067 family)
MKSLLGLATVAATLLAWQGSDLDDLIRKDKERMQGSWRVIAAESKGEKVEAINLKGLLLTFEGDDIQVKENKEVQKRYAFKLRPDKKPKQIDFTYTAGPRRGKTDRGIYQFQGERLTFCIQEDEELARPREFETELKSSLFLVVLERVKK